LSTARLRVTVSPVAAAKVTLLGWMVFNV